MLDSILSLLFCLCLSPISLMKDKKLHKYTFEMSKLEFTNSLEMYLNSAENKLLWTGSP